MSCVDAVHNLQQLFNALVLSQVFSTLDEIAVFPFIVAADRYTLGTTQRRHHEHLPTVDRVAAEQTTFLGSIGNARDADYCN